TSRGWRSKAGGSFLRAKAAQPQKRAAKPAQNLPASGRRHLEPPSRSLGGLAVRGRHRRGRHGYGLLSGLKSRLVRLRAHPLRLALMGTLSLALVWLVLTKSLPFALAPAAPDLALALDPGNPVALVVKARQISERLLAQSSVTQGPAEAQERSAPGGGDNTLARLPEAAGSGGPGEPLGDREAIRKEIARLASLAIAKDPLNAEAVRLLA